MEDVLQQVAELQEAARRLCNIREAEKELDSCFQVQCLLDPQQNSQKIPHQHTQKGGMPTVWKNGSLQWQGSVGGKEYP